MSVSEHEEAIHINLVGDHLGDVFRIRNLEESLGKSRRPLASLSITQASDLALSEVPIFGGEMGWDNALVLFRGLSSNAEFCCHHLVEFNISGQKVCLYQRDLSQRFFSWDQKEQDTSQTLSSRI